MEDNSNSILATLAESLSAMPPIYPLTNFGLPGFRAYVPTGGHWVSCFIENHRGRLTASDGFLFSGQTETCECPDPSLIAAFCALYGPMPIPSVIAYTELWYVPGEGLERLLEIVKATGFPAVPDTEPSISKETFLERFKDILQRVSIDSKIRLTQLSPYVFSAQLAADMLPAMVKGYVAEAVELSAQFFTVQLGTKRWQRAYTKSRTLAFGYM